MSWDDFYKIVNRADPVKQGFMLVIIVLAVVYGLASCAPAQPVWENEESSDWNSLGSGTYWTTINPVRGSIQECIVVYTSGTQNRSVAVDCYERPQ